MTSFRAILGESWNSEISAILPYEIYLFFWVLQENNILFPKTDTIFNCNIIERRPQIELGSATLSAVALSFIFMAVQWFKLENTWMKKLKTLPILLFHFFPQYRAFRVLYFWWKGDTEKWSKEKLVLERDISSIGK